MIQRRVSAGAFVLAASLGAGVLSVAAVAANEESVSWNPRAAAAYMDERQAWWRSWPSAARDHETVCVSCHTALPYALARPALRSALGEQTRSASESRLIDDVVKRVRAWRDMEPWYPDQTRGLPKTAESRGTESVINAIVLSRRDAASGVLSDDARQAFANLWAQQMRTGDLSGAWAWLSFRLEPWEGAESAYFGAALAAIAVGTAPGGYAANAEIQPNLKLLRGYLAKQFDRQPTLNRLMLLWASAGLSDLVTPEQRHAVVTEVFAKQQSDGGWSLSTFGPWRRTDGTTLEASSDGYATGLAAFALRQAGVPAAEPHVKSGLAWLVAHQDKTTGRWPASSLNKQRDPESETGRFMSDVATAYAVLALTPPR
jgi:squalene-hopene/tetraprenyl-beta-curcumene cyclase